MKKYEKMSMDETMEIVKKGGTKKEWLNNEVLKHLDSLNLSQKARNIISTTDPVCEVFAGLMTADDVEKFVEENFNEEC